MVASASASPAGASSPDVALDYIKATVDAQSAFVFMQSAGGLTSRARPVDTSPLNSPAATAVVSLIDCCSLTGRMKSYFVPAERRELIRVGQLLMNGEISVDDALGKCRACAYVKVTRLSRPPAALRRGDRTADGDGRPMPSFLGAKRRPERYLAYFFVAPALVLLLTFRLVPLISGFGLSLTDWNGSPSRCRSASGTTSNSSPPISSSRPRCETSPWCCRHCRSGFSCPCCSP